MAMKKMPVVMFTDSELTTIQNILRATWQDIGHDMIEVYGGPMPRDEVVDVVLDADYAERHARSAEDRDLWARFTALPIEQMDRIARTAFPHSQYS